MMDDGIVSIGYITSTHHSFFDLTRITLHACRYVLVWYHSSIVSMRFSLWILLQQHANSLHNIKHHHIPCIFMFPPCITTCRVVLVLLTVCCAIACAHEFVMLFQGVYGDISCWLRVRKWYFIPSMSFGCNADLSFAYDKHTSQACIAVSCHVCMPVWHWFRLFFHAVLMCVGLMYVCAMDLHVFVSMLCDISCQDEQDGAKEGKDVNLAPALCTLTWVSADDWIWLSDGNTIYMTWIYATGAFPASTTRISMVPHLKSASCSSKRTKNRLVTDRILWVFTFPPRFRCEIDHLTIWKLVEHDLYMLWMCFGVSGAARRSFLVQNAKSS